MRKKTKGLIIIAIVIILIIVVVMVGYMRKQEEIKEQQRNELIEQSKPESYKSGEAQIELPEGGKATAEESKTETIE